MKNAHLLTYFSRAAGTPDSNVVDSKFYSIMDAPKHINTGMQCISVYVLYE